MASSIGGPATRGATCRRSKSWRSDPTKSASDLANYDSEFTELQTQLEDIAGETFNSVALFGSSDLSVNVTESGGTTAFTDFADLSWPGASFTARGALIYNASDGNRAVCVLDFGSDKTVSDGTFTIQFPAAAAGTAIIRIA